jgi:hypothetical protein
MVVIKVVAMFDDREALLRARQELIRAGLASEETIRTEPDLLDEAAEPPPTQTGWERLLAFFDTQADHEVSVYAEGLRRGSVLLVVETPNEQAEAVKDVLRRSGAVDLRRRVHRWITTGWETFDPDAPRFTELEIVDERHASLSEAAAESIAGDADRTVSLFDEKTDRLLGHISEVELAVLQDTLEEEGPGDDDYWINGAEIDAIEATPGATPHLVALLRDALGGNPEGVDIRFEREGEPKPMSKDDSGAENRRA